MTKEEIVFQIQKSSDEVIDYIFSLDETEQNRSKDQKWSVLQHLDHLLLSIQPLNKALLIPLPGLRVLFGKPNRAERNFDETVLKYNMALEKGAKATGRYIPVSKQRINAITKKYRSQSEALAKSISKWNEKDLSNYLLPHPLIGKLTIREMLYFTIYHTHHHLLLMKAGLAN